MSADDRTGILEELLSRIHATRFVLIAALAVAVALAVVCGAVLPAAIGFVVIVAAALLPVRTRLARLAGDQRASATAPETAAARDAVLEAIDLPAFVLTADGTLVHANSAAMALYGAISEGAHLSSRIRAPDILDMVREAGRTGKAQTLEHAERVPSERWFQVRVAPVPGLSADGVSGKLLLTFRDLTEARLTERMRSDFVANASHELRTPLASLTGFIETLQGPAREDAAARDRFLAIMREQAGRMSRLIGDLMALSRLELHAHVPPSEAIDLGPLIAHVCETLKPMATELGVAIRFGGPEPPAIVIGERDELIQVFQNLIENACKYGQSGGFVDVAVRRQQDGAGTPPGMLDVAVRDYGPGIPREHVPRLTERFYRVDAEASRSKNGTGLGLAIVKHILARHRGRLVIKSQLGKGSVFVARFPSA